VNLDYPKQGINIFPDDAPFPNLIHTNIIGTDLNRIHTWNFYLSNTSIIDKNSSEITNLVEYKSNDVLSKIKWYIKRSQISQDTEKYFIVKISDGTNITLFSSSNKLSVQLSPFKILYAPLLRGKTTSPLPTQYQCNYSNGVIEEPVCIGNTKEQCGNISITPGLCPSNPTYTPVSFFMIPIFINKADDTFYVGIYEPNMIVPSTKYNNYPDSWQVLSGLLGVVEHYNMKNNDGKLHFNVEQNSDGTISLRQENPHNKNYPQYLYTATKIKVGGQLPLPSITATPSITGNMNVSNVYTYEAYNSPPQNNHVTDTFHWTWKIIN
jgi:hypothetical protein